MQVGEEQARGHRRDVGEELLGERGLPAVDERRRGRDGERLGERVAVGALHEAFEGGRLVGAGTEALEHGEGLLDPEAPPGSPTRKRRSMPSASGGGEGAFGAWGWGGGPGAVDLRLRHRESQPTGGG